jgi:serine/threonine-protein kinase TTK/MPS1
LFVQITYRSDVWSLGCILYNMIFGRTPFSHIGNTWVKLEAIANPMKKVELPRNGRGIPEELRLSLEWCLRKDPKTRPTVQQLLQLPYDTASTTDPPDPIIAQINALKNKYSVKVSFFFCFFYYGECTSLEP